MLDLGTHTKLTPWLQDGKRVFFQDGAIYGVFGSTRQRRVEHESIGSQLGLSDVATAQPTELSINTCEGNLICTPNTLLWVPEKHLAFHAQNRCGERIKIIKDLRLQIDPRCKSSFLWFLGFLPEYDSLALFLESL